MVILRLQDLVVAERAYHDRGGSELEVRHAPDRPGRPLPAAALDLGDDRHAVDIFGRQPLRADDVLGVQRLRAHVEEVHLGVFARRVLERRLRAVGGGRVGACVVRDREVVRHHAVRAMIQFQTKGHGLVPEDCMREPSVIQYHLFFAFRGALDEQFRAVNLCGNQ